MPRTVIEHIHLEKANNKDRPVSYIISRVDGNPPPFYSNVYWLGGLSKDVK